MKYRIMALAAGAALALTAPLSAALPASATAPPGAHHGIRQGPRAFPKFFLLQDRDGDSTANGLYVNDIHGRGSSAEFADYHHTPLHMRNCVRDRRGNTWCLWEDERGNCLSTRIHPGAHHPSDAMWSACNRTSFYEQWRFVKDVVKRRLFWDPLNRHYGQYLSPADITSCDIVGCPGPVVVWPVINPWGVPRA